MRGNSFNLCNKLDIRKNIFSGRVVMHWQGLPRGVVKSLLLGVFRKKARCCTERCGLVAIMVNGLELVLILVAFSSLKDPKILQFYLTARCGLQCTHSSPVRWIPLSQSLWLLP